jgi:hypothetical protein
MNDLKLERIIKYIIMGLVVVIATRYIPDILIPTKELIMIGATSSITFAILDMVSPAVKVNHNNHNN